MKKITTKKSKGEIKKQLVEKGESIRKSLEHIVKQDAKANTSTANLAARAPKKSVDKLQKAVNDDSDSGADEDVDMDPYRLKDAYYIKQNAKYTNKKKTIVLASRGISSLGRQLMNDIKLMLPHHKAESKLEKKESYTAINTLAGLSGCDSAIFIEARKSEMIMWISKTPNGPTLKGRLTNVHTLRDSTFAGNCLLYSRPLLTFDNAFESTAHLKLIKQVLMHVFGTPNNHPKSKPFCDHCLSFFYFDGRIFFRHYQIAPENEFAMNKPQQQVLTEIGPQFVVEPILILSGSFNGTMLWKNKNYVSPIMMRRLKRESDALRKQQQEIDKKNRDRETDLPDDELSNQNVFSAPN
ncbi:ribosome biogenesis Brix protein, putative [Babesia bigemina]|uniref:Ribosome biogenesis Brix protein, putative n=1 Tax=Babesia bigemina TaxID=5866 RepID=A0A061D0Q9_BABBI|nr:ribosome biogenesis Brix protein, putative [Babesia bigemina]CDR94386.1 ribosome biogenesis Brix protein, putative [Babesia bigemina]|eukprot:XP_012766572.1 ribosome biogenesis Brix protein, putative [Babesia bigemina]